MMSQFVGKARSQLALKALLDMLLQSCAVIQGDQDWFTAIIPSDSRF